MSDDPVLAALARLEAGQATTHGDIAVLRADVASRTDGLEAGLAAIRREGADFREQVLNRLTSIREDIGVNMARVERVAETNTDIRAEVVSLRKENTALWRMLKALEIRVDHIETPGS
jgi:hypothetical protein